MIRLNRYHEEMIEIVSDGLMVVGEDGNIITVNSRMEDLTGFSQQ